MSLKQRITSDLTHAMKSKDADRTGVLRMVKAAIQNREIEKGGEVADDEIKRVLQSLVKQRRDSVEQYEKGGRPELAAKEQAEIAMIEDYLPRAATPEEIERAVAQAMTEIGATTPKQMGAVMKAVQPLLADRFVDNKAVSELVKLRLS